MRQKLQRNTAKLLCKVIENYANNVCLYKWFVCSIVRNYKSTNILKAEYSKKKLRFETLNINYMAFLNFSTETSKKNKYRKKNAE